MRRRSSAPGRSVPAPDLRPSPPRWCSPSAAWSAAACRESSATSRRPTPGAVRRAIADRERRPAPVAEPTADRDSPRADAPTPDPAAESAGADRPPSPGGAAACTGTDENRDFFADAAAARRLDGLLPGPARGLVRRHGRVPARRTAAGCEISYEGPGGARFALREGAFCDARRRLRPGGRSSATAAFGDRTGTLDRRRRRQLGHRRRRGARPAPVVGRSGRDSTMRDLRAISLADAGRVAARQAGLANAASASAATASTVALRHRRSPG